MRLLEPAAHPLVDKHLGLVRERVDRARLKPACLELSLAARVHLHTRARVRIEAQIRACATSAHPRARPLPTRGATPPDSTRASRYERGSERAPARHSAGFRQQRTRPAHDITATGFVNKHQNPSKPSNAHQLSQRASPRPRSTCGTRHKLGCPHPACAQRCPS
eukprot:1877860-Pleurochrysis_carterae.AAC.1